MTLHHFDSLRRFVVRGQAPFYSP
ncbi:MAG: hypothetical protein QOJ95_3463, partial [Mycobacterium sp.]|nr:hypothetical protein [Mycobacterium sp.]